MSHMLKFSAGAFEVESWSGGHPHWVRICHKGKEIAHGVHHGEIKDLAFCLERMAATIRHELGANYKHEMD